ncbi:hypothetical protein OIU78_019190 [Salix suchowensis]|nr:hypothetical protein OIU78_019190 [Salix suchowensis]
MTSLSLLNRPSHGKNMGIITRTQPRDEEKISFSYWKEDSLL